MNIKKPANLGQSKLDNNKRVDEKRLDFDSKPADRLKP